MRMVVSILPLEKFLPAVDTFVEEMREPLVVGLEFSILGMVN